jgi:hypothetical protein
MLDLGPPISPPAPPSTHHNLPSHLPGPPHPRLPGSPSFRCFPLIHLLPCASTAFTASPAGMPAEGSSVFTAGGCARSCEARGRRRCTTRNCCTPSHARREGRGTRSSHSSHSREAAATPSCRHRRGNSEGAKGRGRSAEGSPPPRGGEKRGLTFIYYAVINKYYSK